MDTTPILKFVNKILQFIPMLKILSTEESIQVLLKKHVSLSRYGDGEMFLMSGNSICFQEYDKLLASRLSDVMAMSYKQDFQVGIPLAVNSTYGYNSESKSFWEKNMLIYRWQYYIKGWRKRVFLNSSITWLFSDAENRNLKLEDFKSLLSLWENENVLIVEGETTRLGVETGMFLKTKSCRRLICPSQNSFAQYDRIYEEILKVHRKDELILICLGPTATLLAYDLYCKGLWAIDIGQINKEYNIYKEISKIEEKEVIAENDYSSQIIDEI